MKPTFHRVKEVQATSQASFFKLNIDESMFFTILSPIVESTRPSEDGLKKTTRYWIKGVQLELNLHGLAEVNLVLVEKLKQEYPDNGFIGKSFEIIKRKVEGKRFFDYEIHEIEIEIPKEEIAEAVEVVTENPETTNNVKAKTTKAK
jgi:hypothetical protein